ncbi:unnamed protein product [Camellia sinensis]
MALLVESPVVVGTTNVFEEGKLSVESITVNESSSSSPPKPLLIVTPTLEGTYPVLLLFHGFLIQNQSYEQILQHISSHGFIVVAPQLYTFISSGTEEVDSAAEVTNWLSAGLQSTLPKNVQANLLKLALSGHSRGGKAAFALALGHAETQPTLKFSALIGLDPVAGSSIKDQIDPKILTFVPRSFDLSIPIAVIGTGKSPACAPDGVNHCEFFTESKPPCYYFYAKDYGHVDMLDDPNIILRLACSGGKGDMDPFKKCVGGIFVAFLKACLDGENEDLKSIGDEPGIAPVTLDPVIYIEA